MMKSHSDFRIESLNARNLDRYFCHQEQIEAAGVYHFGTAWRLVRWTESELRGSD